MGFKIGPPAPPPLPKPPLQKGPPTNSILEQLLPCFWRDVDFPVSSFKTTFSQDLVQHKYWGVDGVQVEATGRGALEIEAIIPFVNGIVPGKDERWAAPGYTGLYPDQFRKFYDAMTDKSVGLMIHPEFGGVYCRPVSVDFAFDPKTRDGVIVTARWIETLNQDELTPFGPGGVETTAFLAAGDLDDDYTDLRGLAPDLPAFELSFEDMMNGVSGFFDKISTFKAIAANKPGQILARINQVEDSINRAKSPMTWPAQDAVSRIQNALADLGNSKSKGSRKVLRLTTKTKTTLTNLVSQCPGNTPDDLINLNPNLLSNPDVTEGLSFDTMPPEKLYRASHGNDEQIELVFTDGYNKTAISKWVEYSFESDFMKPSDAWSFVVSGDNVTEEQFQLMRCGAQVELSLNGEIQGTGYIDSIEISASSSGGTEYRIQGRDNLAQAVDACANPTTQFKAGMSLADVLKQLFGPFGWSQDEHFVIDNSGNRNARSQVSAKFSKGKKTFGKPLKGSMVHQLKPTPGEGVFAFASRVSQRFGLWIWCSADGNTLVVSKPDFDQPPIYKLFRNDFGTTNVLGGSVSYNVANQPTHIIADSFGPGGEFGSGRFKTIMKNNVVTADPGPVDLAVNYKSARTIVGSTIPTKSILKAPRERPAYMRFDEAKTQDELDKLVMREMAHLQHQSLTVHYTVEGHGQNTPNGFAPWATDTTVAVDDQPARLDETLYVMGRTFHKSRNSGTRTDLHLIRLNTLVF